MDNKHKQNKVIKSIEKRTPDDHFLGEMYLSPNSLAAADALKKIKKGTKGSNNNNNNN